MKYALVTTAASVLMLGGCAIGSGDYGCKGMPSGVQCISTRQAYQATNGGASSIKSNIAEGNQSTSSRDPDSSPKVEPPQTDVVVDTFVTPQLPDKPIPIRTPAQVMRIKVFTWEDSKTGALITPGYIYSEIEPRRWVIGKPETVAQQQGRLFKPLEYSSAPELVVPPTPPKPKNAPKKE